MRFLDKKKFKFLKQIKQEILRKFNKAIEIDEFANSHFSEKKYDKLQIFTFSIFAISIALGVFSYSYIYIKNKINETDVSESINTLKIVIPHPDDTSYFDTYKTLDYKIKKGDNIATVLTKNGISNEDAYNALLSLKQIYDVTKIKVNQIITIKYRTELTDAKKDIVEQRVLEEIRIEISPEEEAIVVRNDKSEYLAKKVSKTLVKHYIKYSGKIETSLYIDGIEAGIPANIMMDVIKYYSFDVDFQRDIRKGDKFEILFESFYTEEGEKVRDGKILFANLELSNKNIPLYRYKTKSGYDIYFDENGRSVQKSLMKTPINGARLSSGFGMRTHPILGYSKMHKGIDFAAPRGTPFFAAGNGVIVKASTGWNGGFGNYIKIRHNSEYSTEYAHISRFAKGIAVGKRVRQGQVIAYVGNTGRSTGPHLHYSVIYREQRLNPKRVKSVPSLKLMGADLIDFKEQKNLIDSYILNTPNQNKFKR